MGELHALQYDDVSHQKSSSSQREFDRGCLSGPENPLPKVAIERNSETSLEISKVCLKRATQYGGRGYALRKVKSGFLLNHFIGQHPL